MSSSTVKALTPARPALTVYLLALGALVINTEGFMMAGLLPHIAASFGKTISAAGLLVTVFAFTYALSSPILNSLFAGVARERIVLLAYGLFSVTCLLAGLAPDLLSLTALRVLLGIAAGLYMPCASAVASSLVPPERRGRALATVHGGVTLAIAIGVPACTWLASHHSWRQAYFCIAATGCVMLLAFWRHLGWVAHVKGARQTWTQRLAVVRQPGLLLSVLATFAWAAGIWTLYPYMGKLLSDFASMTPNDIAALLSLYGVAALAGVVLAGVAVDRWGPPRVLMGGVVALALIYAGMSLALHVLPPVPLSMAMACAMCAWGIAGFTFNPAQQTNLLRLSSPALVPVTLSINGSFLYMGFAAGPALGGWAWASGHAQDTGFLASACELLALALLAFLHLRGRKGGEPSRH